MLSVEKFLFLKFIFILVTIILIVITFISFFFLYVHCVNCKTHVAIHF